MKNKIIALCCAALLFSFSFVPLRAEASDNILRIVRGYTQSSIAFAYESLSNDQKDICDYLVGCYNLTYLGSRGFYFNPGQITDFNSFESVVRQLGAKILNQTGMSTWGSRMSDVFCQYLSSCIQYSQTQSSNFLTWYQNLPADFSIPYGKDMYDAWNNFYNDISNDGISAFQISEGEWDVVPYQDFPFVGYAWSSSSAETGYNNFVTSYSPVLFCKSDSRNGYVIGFPNNNIPDALFLLRNSPIGAYRFGKSSISLIDNTRVYVGMIWLSTQDKILYSLQSGNFNINVSSNSIGSSLHTNYIDDAYYILRNRGYVSSITWSDTVNTNYSIKHVYLVDSLSTLSNPEEITPTYGVNITGNDTLSVIPKEDMLFYIKQLETDLPFPYPASDPVPIKNIVINNTYNYYGDQADPATDFETAVVDRSAQSFSEPYSVDEGIFTQASEYITYLWENTKPLILYTKDLLECLTITPIENDDEEQEGSTGLALAIYGSLAVGVAGGLISKLLL